MSKEIETVVNRVVNRYPKYLKEDLTQECWLALIPKMKAFEPSKGSLFRFLKNKLNRVCKEFTNSEELAQHESLTLCVNMTS